MGAWIDHLLHCRTALPREVREERTGSTEKTEPEADAATGSAAIDPTTVATVTGKIRFVGEKPKLSRLMMDQDPVCVQKHSGPVYAEDGEVNDDGTLPNVFVYVKEGADKYSFPTPTESVEIDQEGCVYKPHVLGLQVNQTLRILSKDATTHNIHPCRRTTGSGTCRSRLQALRSSRSLLARKS